jgi:hypothetical protein
MVVHPEVYRIIAMSKNEPLGATDSLDWNQAWSVVSQLAAARGTTLRELRQGDHAVAGSTIDSGAGHAAMETAAHFAPIAPDQLVRDLAAIEQAAAALRRAEPARDRNMPGAPRSVEPRGSRSVWPLVCVIWLTAALVVSCAIGAIVLLLG